VVDPAQRPVVVDFGRPQRLHARGLNAKNARRRCARFSWWWLATTRGLHPRSIPPRSTYPIAAIRLVKNWSGYPDRTTARPRLTPRTPS